MGKGKETLDPKGETDATDNLWETLGAIGETAVKTLEEPLGETAVKTLEEPLGEPLGKTKAEPIRWTEGEEGHLVVLKEEPTRWTKGEEIILVVLKEEPKGFPKEISLLTFPLLSLLSLFIWYPPFASFKACL